MEKKKWLWKRNKSPGGSETSESMSSPSEKDSDSQEQFKASPSHSSQSPEVTSKAISNEDGQSPEVISKAISNEDSQSPEVTSKSISNEDDDDANETIKNLTEKLSAALVNVSAKDELVKQHAKVAEEAVAGWEKAENELAVLKEQLESATKKNSVLEDRLGHLDGALKECVRQLRQARDEQEEKIQESVAKITEAWESTKSELALHKKAEDSKTADFLEKIEFLEKENLALQLELQQQCDELEIRTIERDLSTQAAETASKQHLDSIRKVAKLEAECRKLRAVVNRESKSNAASSIYVESLTDSQSDNGDRLNIMEMDTCKSSNSDSNKNFAALSMEIDLMDDFLEMEKLASLPQNPDPVKKTEAEECSRLRVEIEAMVNRTVELEQKIEKLEQEKSELKMDLERVQGSGEASQVQLIEAMIKLEDVQRELNGVSKSKQSMEDRVAKMEAEAVRLSSSVDSLEEEVRKEKEVSEEFGAKCRRLEEELARKEEELEMLRYLSLNNQPKIKQEDLTAAAGRLVECQKTIVSLKKQLDSLATLEDFLIDTTSIPESSPGGLMAPRGNGGELWRLHSNGTFSPGRDSINSTMMKTSASAEILKNENRKSPVSSSSSSAASSTVSSEKNRNGFAKFFSRTKNGIQLEI